MTGLLGEQIVIAERSPTLFDAAWRKASGKASWKAFPKPSTKPATRRSSSSRNGHSGSSSIIEAHDRTTFGDSGRLYFKKFGSQTSLDVSQ